MRLESSFALEVALPEPSVLAVDYASARYVLLPELLPSVDAAVLFGTTTGVEASQVRCHRPDVTWLEQRFESGQPAYDFFDHPDVRAFVGRTIGAPLGGLEVWTSCYRQGEYIDPHCDRTGLVQFLICLTTTAGPEYGGELNLDSTPIFLQPGAAVLFEATRLTHFTTPLLPSAANPEPLRVVLVGRYFDPV